MKPIRKESIDPAGAGVCYDPADLEDEPVIRRVVDQQIAVDYYLGLRHGDAPDLEYEGRSLSADFSFISYDVAEVLFAVAQESGVPIERVAQFLAAGTYGGGDKYLPNLLRRIEILAPSCNPIERCKLICSGVVGDGRELVEIFPYADSVGFLVKLCRAVSSLAEQKGHDAVDLRSIEIEDDDWTP